VQRTMKAALDYAWPVLRALISIFVVVVVFARLSDRFEVTVVAILCLIYVSVRNLALASEARLYPLLLGFYSEIYKIRTALQDPEAHTFPKQLRDANDMFGRHAVVTVVDGACLVVITLISFFELFIHL
jgi:hypothetical protein